MRHDLLSDALTIIRNAESVGKSGCVLPSSDLIKNVLEVMKANNYIKSFKSIDDKKGGKIEVKLAGKINSCRAVKPRFSVKKDEYEKFERRFLPAKDFGILIVSTPKGLMTQKQAIEKQTGGRLLGFVY